MASKYPPREDIGHDQPLRLAVAAALAFPDGSMTASEMSTCGQFRSVPETSKDASENANLANKNGGLDAWTDPKPKIDRKGDPSPTAQTEANCDYCGKWATPADLLNRYDWPGRPNGMWLHRGCEGPWFNGERSRRPPAAPTMIDGGGGAGMVRLDIPEFLRRARPGLIGPPAISAGPDDDLGDIDPRWQR
jgi:hypothetical protein